MQCSLLEYLSEEESTGPHVLLNKQPFLSWVYNPRERLSILPHPEGGAAMAHPGMP